jgi:hypothetical protein
VPETQGSDFRFWSDPNVRTHKIKKKSSKNSVSHERRLWFSCWQLVNQIDINLLFPKSAKGTLSLYKRKRTAVVAVGQSKESKGAGTTAQPSLNLTFQQLDLKQVLYFLLCQKSNNQVMTR